MQDISQLPTPKPNVMGPEPSRWFKFNKVKGPHTEDSYILRKEIKLINQEGVSESK